MKDIHINFLSEAAPSSAFASKCLLFICSVLWSMVSLATAEATPTADMPAAIHWKQDLFLVPYQWSSPAEAGAAQAVWLYVSKDRGVNWQKISEAKPQVTSFNYRAEGDGEYWFAIRTIDRLGRAWPQGPYQPELRVIVDTELPVFSSFVARQRIDGNIDLEWHVTDLHFDPSSLRLETQSDASGNWQPVPAASLMIAGPAVNQAFGNTAAHHGQAIWRPLPGSHPIAVRATVADFAGNTAMFQTQIGPAEPSTAGTSLPGGTFDAAAWAGSQRTATNSPPAPQSTTTPNVNHWVSGSAVPPVAAARVNTQPWPADQTVGAPFRVADTSHSWQGDGITAYGNPATRWEMSSGSAGDSDNRVAARFANDSPNTRESSIGAMNSSEQRVLPLEPYRQPSSNDALRDTNHIPEGAKVVGARTFALEYDLENTAHWGVSKVELWGTRDGGRSWHYFAADEDHQSPLIVTVDAEGLYGFRIVVESAGSAPPAAPQSGDQPELWIAVDLHRPVIELKALHRGSGNLADHLILRWNALDDNLEARPISLYYSSRATGPWSAIATNLENTGHYAWRVERHVPARFYVRAEARDTAGNLAAFQTRDPIDFAALPPQGQLIDAEAYGPTAAESGASFR